LLRTLALAVRRPAVALGGLSLAVLHPGPLSGDRNEDSVIIRLTCGSVDVLLMGDSTTASEAAILGADLVPDVEVVKAGHHGSRTSSGLSFVNAARPEHVVFSAGLDSQFGHPHPDIVARYQEAGALVIRTDTSAGDDTKVMTSNCATYSFAGTVSGAQPTAAIPGTTPTRTAMVTATATPVPGGNCSPAYPTVCIPPAPPDLDCSDIPFRRFTVLAPDPHRFDGADNDGVGCES